VWSLGHRNVQGLAWDAAGRMYASELGQDRFDEFNRIEAGANYGWPVVEGTGDDPRYVNPLLTWSTDDASPSGLAIRGDNAYMACLRGEKVYRITLDGAGGVAGTPQPLFAGQFGRIRQVVVEPAGTLLMLTSNRDGRGTVRPGDDKIIRFDG
jgi:glucose/arabinose dehydrogenase